MACTLRPELVGYVSSSHVAHGDETWRLYRRSSVVPLRRRCDSCHNLNSYGSAAASHHENIKEDVVGKSSRTPVPGCHTLWLLCATVLQ